MKDLKNLEAGEYFQIVWKRRWYFLSALVVVVVGVSIYAWRMPDVYRSETRIMVEDPLVSQDYVRSGARSTPEDRIGSIRQQLASRTFLERMIEQFQMFGYGSDSGFVMEQAVRAAQQRIGIEKTSNNTFTISFVASDPQFAQAFTRQLAQEVIRISTSSRKDKVLATDQFIDEQLRQSTAALAAQEEKIKQFKIAHLGELPEQGNSNMSALSGLHSQLTATESAIHQAQERQKLLEFNYQERRRLNLLSKSIAATENAVKPPESKQQEQSPSELELAAKKKVLEQLLAKYTPNHPDVVTVTRDINRLEEQVREQTSSAASETATAATDSKAGEQRGKPMDQEEALESAFQFQAESIKNEIAKREKDKQEILRQIKVYQTRLNLAPALEQELATLLREQDVLKTQYETLQRQKFSTQMASTAETDNRNETYRIIDEANLPVRARYPNRLHIILMGIGGGLVLGIGAAFGRELLDSTIASEDEARRLLNLPVLVTIPTVTKPKKKSKAA